MEKRTLEMLMSNITWSEVAEEIGVSRNAIYEWRVGKDKQKHKAIEMAVKHISKRKKKERV